MQHPILGLALVASVLLCAAPLAAQDPELPGADAAAEAITEPFRIGYAVAEASEAPAWVPGDEFADERAACGTE